MDESTRKKLLAFSDMFGIPNAGWDSDNVPREADEEENLSTGDRFMLKTARLAYPVREQATTAISNMDIKDPGVSPVDSMARDNISRITREKLLQDAQTAELGRELGFSKSPIQKAKTALEVGIGGSNFRDTNVKEQNVVGLLKSLDEEGYGGYPFSDFEESPAKGMVMQMSAPAGHQIPDVTERVRPTDYHDMINNARRKKMVEELK